MTWQQVGELVDDIGRATGGSQWRQAALRADAPARERLLHERLWYLEQEGFAVARPVTTTDVGVFKALVDTLTVLDALMRRSADYIGGHIDGSDDADEGAFWFHVEPPSGAWMARLAPFEAYCEVLLCVVDDWWPQGTGEPAVGAGYTLDSQLYDTLSANAGCGP